MDDYYPKPKGGRTTAPVLMEAVQRQGSLSEYVPTFSVSAAPTALADKRRSDIAIKTSTMAAPVTKTNAQPARRPSGSEQRRPSYNEGDSSAAAADAIRPAPSKIFSVAQAESAMVLDLLECPHCSRRFAEVPYGKHIRICEKVNDLHYLVLHDY
jgi:hypothetical protein